MSPEDEAEQDAGLAFGFAGLCKAFPLLELMHRRRRLVAVNSVDRTRIRTDGKQQALQVPDWVAASTPMQIRTGESEVDMVQLVPRDGSGYSIYRSSAKIGLERPQRVLSPLPEVAVNGARVMNEL